MGVSIGMCCTGSCGTIHSLAKEPEGVESRKAVAVNTVIGPSLDRATPFMMSNALS